MHGAQMLGDTRGLFVGGCAFDELPPGVIVEAAAAVRARGGAVFFDPGPRAWTFAEPGRRRALDALLDATDVVLMTQVGSFRVSRIP